MKRVVITGLGVVSPVGSTIERFWDSVSAGRCGIGEITRFDTTDYKAKLAAEVKDFDPALYLEKSDLRRTDIYAQYALGAAAQAMADSGLAGTVEPERLGVYVGSGVGGMTTLEAQHRKLMESGPKRISPFFITMMIGNMAAGLIAIKYEAKGPSLPIVTACATSTNAVGEAFHAIRHGYADAILAGGAEATITPLAVSGFINCMALSTATDPHRASIPFDKERDGFVMGEGAGILVLEEYEHAKARGAKIYAEIAGYGNTCDAHHVTAPDPDAVGSSASIRLALQEAGWQPGSSLYINAHGTSTPLNDRTETLAIKKALGEEEARRAFISSTKSVTGHMLGAAGAVEAIVATLALQNRFLPPTANYQVPDPDCDLNYLPNQGLQKAVDYAVSTSLGFGGHNACIALKRFGE